MPTRTQLDPHHHASTASAGLAAASDASSADADDARSDPTSDSNSTVGEISALITEMGRLVDLRIALARTEWSLLRASALRLLVWVPLGLLLLLSLLLTMVVGLGWAVLALTGSAALGWTAATLLQVAILVASIATIRRLLHDGSFPRTRANLRGASQMLRKFGSEPQS